MDDLELARLLGRGDGPSVLEKEAIRERVLAEHRPRWRLGLAVIVPLAVSAALAFLLIRSDQQDEFAARGDGAAEPALRVVCVETGAVGSCPEGGTLAFERAGRRYRHLALFARRSDGLVIWYFPSAEAAAPPLSSHQPVLPKGIKLGREQPAGEYEIVAVFSDHPLSRAQIKERLVDSARSGPELKVIRQRFTVKAAR